MGTWKLNECTGRTNRYVFLNASINWTANKR